MKKKNLENEKEPALDGQVADLEGGVSDVSEHVVNGAGALAVEEGTEARDEDYSGVTDKYGRPFDPSLHVADATGGPVLNKGKRLGGFVKIRPSTKKPLPVKSKVVRPKKRVLPKQEEVEEAGAPPPLPPPTLPAPMAGALVAGLTFQIGQVVFGDEGAPMRDGQLNEEEFMTNAYTRYFEATGAGANVSPGYLILIALGYYSARRLTMPKPRKRVGAALAGLGRAGTWLLERIRGGRARKPRGMNHGAQSDVGHDGIGKDDTSKSVL